MLTILVFAAIGSLVPTTAAAQTSIPIVQPVEKHFSKTVSTPFMTAPQRKDPFRKLFRTTPLKPERPEPTQTLQTTRPWQKVCGSLVIEADPKVDPLIRIPKPDGTFAMRILPKPECAR